MAAFKEWMETLKSALAPAGAPSLKPVELMAKLFDIADVHLANQPTSSPVSLSATPSVVVSEHFFPSAGKMAIYL